MRTRQGYPGGTAILAVAILVAASASLADVVPAGQISGSWTVAGSPYLIDGEIEVPPGASLAIEPGVEVRFRGHYALNVRGALFAIGAPGDTILFHAQNPATGWHSLRFLDTATSGQPVSEVRYCRIQDGLATGSCPDNSGGGIYLYHATAVIADCLITGNRAIYGQATWGGGGIYCDFSSAVTIERNTIVGNVTDHDGGGIYCSWSAPIIRENLLCANSAIRGAGIACFLWSAADIRANTIAANFGEALYLSGSAAWVVNNRIADNDGPGIHCRLAAPKIIGNLVTGNAAVAGAGILLEGSSPPLVNNTVADNAAGSQGGGVAAMPAYGSVTTYSQPVLTNTILWQNTGTTGPQLLVGTGCTATLQYCDVQELSGIGVAGAVTIGEGNQDAMPGWAGGDEHPYCICADSPLRDAGTPDVSGLNLPTEDLAGHDRLQGGRVDIGAYEYTFGVAVPEASAPALVRLLPSRPNPFNPRTTVTFWLDAAQVVRLEIVDLVGRRVVTLWDGPAPAGAHEVSWHGGDATGRPVSSGTYVARLRAGSGTASTRLMLVR